MAKEELPAFAITTSLSPVMISFPLNCIGILREAMKIPARNGKFMLQMMLLILSPFSLVVLLHYLLARPLIAKVEDSYEHSSLDQKDVRALMGLETLFFLAFCIVSFLGMMLAIYSSALTYLRKSIGQKDLILWIRSSWKKPLITWLYFSFLTIIFIVLCLVMIKVTTLISTVNATFLWSVVVGMVGASFYLYLAALWTLGMVISVVENDCHGSEVLCRARVLIRGRKFQGFCLMLILVLLSVPIYVLFYVTSTDDDDELGLITQFAFGFVATVLFCLTKFFTFVVFTVFYYECKQNHGEKVEIDQLGSGYGLVCHQPHVDLSLPN